MAEEIRGTSTGATGASGDGQPQNTQTQTEDFKSDAATAINADVSQAGKDQSDKGTPPPSNGKGTDDRINNLRKAISNGTSVEELDRMGLLMIGDKEKLTQNSNYKNNPTEATIRRKSEDNAVGDAQKAGPFKQGDVIDYMFENWLIDGFLEIDKEIRSLGLQAMYRLGKTMDEAKYEDKIKQEQIKKSKTFKDMDTISNLMSGRLEGIAAENMQDAKITSLIAKGKICDEGNEALLESYLNTLADRDGKPLSKEGKEAEKAALQELCRDPQNSANKAALMDCAVGYGISQAEKIYDRKEEIVLMQMSFTEIGRNLAANPKAYEGQDIKAVFKATMDKNKELIDKITAGERSQFVQEYRDKLESRDFSRFSLDGVIKDNTKKISKLAKLSENAGNEMVKELINGNFAELGNEPKKRSSYVKFAEQGLGGKYEAYQKGLSEEIQGNFQDFSDSIQKGSRKPLDAEGHAMSNKAIDDKFKAMTDSVKAREDQLTAREADRLKKRAQWAERFPILTKRVVTENNKYAANAGVEEVNTDDMLGAGKSAVIKTGRAIKGTWNEISDKIYDKINKLR